MSTEPNLLGQSALVESHNISTFDERMARVAKGESADIIKSEPMTIQQVIDLKNGGKRKSQRKSQRKNQRKNQRKSQRKSQRKRQHKSKAKHQRKTRK